MARDSTMSDVSRTGNATTIGSMMTGRPVAYVAVEDPAARAEISGQLHERGCRVIPQPTGFHVIRAIADVIDGGDTWLRPSIIVIDVWARGCSGLTIAAGLRELGVAIPIVLVRRANDEMAALREPVSGVQIMSAADAARFAGRALDPAASVGPS